MCLDSDSLYSLEEAEAFSLDTQSINILLTPQRNFRNVSLSITATRLPHTSVSPRPHKCYHNNPIKVKYMSVFSRYFPSKLSESAAQTGNCWFLSIIITLSCFFEVS